MTSKEEGDLSSFLKQCATVGYGKTRRDVLNIAQNVAEEKGVLRGSRISQGWWHRFRLRQNDLTLRRGDNTAYVRMDAVNAQTMKQYFGLLGDTLKEHGLLNCPSQIYNVDESGMPLDPKAPNVVAVKGAKKVRYRSPGRKGQVTVVGCGNASGQVIPPMIIFDAKKLNHAWTQKEVPGTKYGLSDKGWITTDLFEAWLMEHFLQYAVSLRPLLLLLDGHSTHYQPDVVRYAKENNVIMLCLPPHTTHETQPLDCGAFAPLKSHWSTVCHDFIQKNPGKVITKFNFNQWFSEAWLHAIVPSNIISGFRTCGVYPFNPGAVRVTDDDYMPEQGSSSAWLEEEEPPSVCYHVSDSNVSDSHFTSEQEELFRRRFDEGYDIEDAEYTRWLRIAHPELQSNLSNSSLTQTPSLTDFFPGVEPQSAQEVENETVLTLTKNSSPLSSSSTPHLDASLSKYLTSPHLSSPDTPAVLKNHFRALVCLLVLTLWQILRKRKERSGRS